MFRTFGEYVLSFSKALDSINKSEYDRTLEEIHQYLEESLKISLFEIVNVKRIVGGEITLEPYSVKGGEEEEQFPVKIKDPDSGKDVYKGHISYSFDKNVAIWIVSKSKGTLYGASDYVNLWSTSASVELEELEELEELPDYWGLEEIRLSLIHI